MAICQKSISLTAKLSHQLHLVPQTKMVTGLQLPTQALMVPMDSISISEITLLLQPWVLDYSGNGNNWTLNGFNVSTANTTYDIMIDVPEDQEVSKQSW
jgi:hypothetical protein